MKNAIALSLVVLLTPFISFAAFDRDLQYGSTGNDVKEMQELLTTQGHYSGPITGNFYSLTRQAVIKFQIANNLSPAAGYFGPKSRARANAILAAQDDASNAQAIQETGATSSPVKNDAASILQAQVNALLAQIKLLTSQAQTQTSVQQQTQTTLLQTQQSIQQIQQNTTPTPPPPPPATPQTVFGLSLTPDKTTVAASGYNSVAIKVSALKNGQIYSNQSVTMTTPDAAQNDVRVTSSNGGENTFTYYPKTVGTHTLTFSWSGISKSIDILAVPYLATNPKVVYSGTNGLDSPLECGNTNVAVGKVSISAQDAADPTTVESLSVDSNNGPVFVCAGSNCSGGTIFSDRPNANNDFVLKLAQITKTGNFSVAVNAVKAIGTYSGSYKTVEGLPVTINYEIKDKISYQVQSVVPNQSAGQTIMAGNVDIWYLIRNSTNNPINVNKIKARITTSDPTPRTFDVETPSGQSGVVIASCSSNQAGKLSFNNPYETITGPLKIETISVETNSSVPATGENVITKWVP